MRDGHVPSVKEATARRAPDGLPAILHSLCEASCDDEVMRVVARGVRTLVDADGASVVLRDRDRCHYVEEDAISPLWKGRKFAIGSCISGWSMINRQQVVVPDVFADSRIPLDAYRPTFVRSLAITPVGVPEPMAALGAYWSQGHEATAGELEVLQALADAAALALARLSRPAEQVSESKTRAGRRTPASGMSDSQGSGPSFDADRTYPASLVAYGVAAACVAAATVLRLGIGSAVGPGPVVFLTYLPAALLALLIGGAGPGCFAAAAGALVGFGTGLVPLSPAWMVDILLYAVSFALMMMVMRRYQRAVSRLMREDAAHLTLAREQGHRLKNALTVAEAIVRRSLKDDPGVAETLCQRLRAGLAELDPTPGAEAPRELGAFILDQLRPFDLNRFHLAGATTLSISPSQQKVIALAVHELATNALKYGSLSTFNGTVEIECHSQAGVLKLSWREAGGPRVTPPSRRGYGSILLRRLVEAQRGDMSLDFQPSGLTAEFFLPLATPAAA
jgi:two-component sensor histidine kinase